MGFNDGKAVIFAFFIYFQGYVSFLGFAFGYELPFYPEPSFVFLYLLLFVCKGFEVVNKGGINHFFVYGSSFL